MKKRNGFHRIIVTAVVFVMLIQLTGCGYFIHPERRHQPKGKIDTSIAILDGLGLLLFIIPGVIAFVVDFSNNTIYLPPGQSSIDQQEKNELFALKLPQEKLSKERIENIVSQHYGYKIDIDSKDFDVYEVNNIDEVRSYLVHK